jgi:pimeloyl-ACP methyl ester carboxylesterase
MAHPWHCYMAGPNSVTSGGSVLPGLSATYDVVAPDLRGFGETEKPVVGPNPNATAETHAEDLQALADRLGFDRFGLVSGDVGAYVAQVFARKYPDRLTGPSLR